MGFLVSESKDLNVRKEVYVFKF